MYKVKLFIKLKKQVLDPQGNAVRNALNNLGFSEVKSVRIGKLIEIELEALDQTDAEQKVKQMCEKLLANPVTEDYEIFSLEELK